MDGEEHAGYAADRRMTNSDHSMNMSVEGSSRATRGGIAEPLAMSIATEGALLHRPNWCSSGRVAGNGGQNLASWLMGNTFDTRPVEAAVKVPLSEVECSPSGSSGTSAAGEPVVSSSRIISCTPESRPLSRKHGATDPRNNTELHVTQINSPHYIFSPVD